MARSVVRDTVKVSGGTWHNSSYYKGWKWKGDTSSDEVVGHMFALSIAYDLIAESIEEKDQVFQLIDDIVGKRRPTHPHPHPPTPTHTPTVFVCNVRLY